MIERKLVYYGLCFATVFFIIGLLTGKGGPLIVNFLTSLFLGACIAASLALVKKFGGPKE